MSVCFVWVGVFYSFSASAVKGGWRPSIIFCEGEADGRIHAFNVKFSAVIPIDSCDGGEELSRYSEALVIGQHNHPMNPYAIDYSFPEKREGRDEGYGFVIPLCDEALCGIVVFEGHIMMSCEDSPSIWLDTIEPKRN